jgi:hypothetical protein
MFYWSFHNSDFILSIVQQSSASYYVSTSLSDFLLYRLSFRRYTTIFRLNTVFSPTMPKRKVLPVSSHERKSTACAVAVCGNGPANFTATFHKFPNQSEPIRLKAWLNAYICLYMRCICIWTFLAGIYGPVK